MPVPKNLRLILTGKRHPFSLRPNKQEAVVTVSAPPWQPESGGKTFRRSGKSGLHA